MRIILRVRYMYGTTTKFKSVNIFISATRDQTAKFKDRQYFRLYGSRHSTYQVRVAFFKVVHAARVRVTLPSANHGPLPGKPSICSPTFMYYYCECKPKNEMQGKALETKL